MKIRTILLIYLIAFFAGAIFKYIQYLFQPDSFVHLNSTVIELTIVSAIVTVFLSLFYLFKKKKTVRKED